MSDEDLPGWAKILRGFFFGQAEDAKLRQEGVSIDPHASAYTSIPFSATGYDHAADIQERVSRLLSLQEEAINNPAWQPKDGKTYCNRAFAFLAQGCGYFISPSDSADTIIARISMDSRWREDSMERAHLHALKGGLAAATFIDRPHGHICAFAPLPQEPDSGSWGGHVPMVANVGEENGFMPISKAFAAAKRPHIRYFLLTESAA